VGVIKITRGPIHAAVRWVLYGDAGIGKTTLAAQCPGALVLDTEDGSRQLDVARAEIADWQSLTLAVKELAVDAQGFQTVVIDSADWAEKLLIEHLTKQAGKRSIEDFGFGKGYTMLAEHWAKFLDSCDRLIDRGMNVVFIAHSTVRRISPPDMTDGFDRYELKLTKQVSPLLREWCDLLTFATYKTKLVEGGDGRMKATGKSRVLHTERSPAFDAKNRYGLPEEMPLDWAALEAVFTAPAGSLPAIPPAALREAPAGQSTDVPLVEQIRGYIAGAKNVRTLGRVGDRIDELEQDGQVTAEDADELRGLVDARHDEIEPKTQEAK
jgi:hypothetical protein